MANRLGCYCRTFNWSGGVPEPLVIDNAKCAITKAHAPDQLVQRA